MHWFRSQRRVWGWTALFALTFQLVLSFGHVHGPAAHATQIAATSATATPGEPNGTGDSDTDYCAICAVQTLLTGAQVASAPVLALPVAVASAEIGIATEAARVTSSRAAFRSRAPPQI